MNYFYTVLLLICFAFSTNAQIIYVKTGSSGNGTSWTNARSDLKTAMDNATAGTQIWVAEGTYLPHSTDRNASFIVPNDVQVLGGFPTTGEPELEDRDPQLYPTILSGNMGSASETNDNAFTVIQMVNTSNAVLDGFSIADGNANRQGDNQAEQLSSGGGMYLAATTANQAFSSTIRNCRFENNIAISGGAIFIIGKESSTISPTFENCIFQNNRAEFGGAIHNEAITLGSNNSFFENCSFNNNEGIETGGALNNIANNGTIDFNFNACLFNTNESPVGGAIFNFPNVGSITAQVTNSIFYANTAESGGAIDNFAFGEDAISFTLSHCTFTGNRADVGAALSTFGAGAIINATNCIFWDNTAAENGGSTASNFAGGITNFNFSLVQENTCSEAGFDANCGNMIFNQNPLFVDIDNLDFTLAPCSPALNAGTNAGIPLEDFNGNDRNFGGNTDLGAVEWNGLPTLIALNEVIPTHISCNGANNGSAQVNLSGGVTPYQFLWNNDIGNTQNPQNLAPGSYQLSVEDAVGCRVTSSFTILEPTAVLATPNVLQSVTCFEGSDGSANISVEGGTMPYTFLWSNGSDMSALNNLNAGSHTVTVTDANNCETTALFQIEQAQEIVIDITIDQSISCFAVDNGAITANAVGGTGTLSFEWNNGANSNNLNNLSTGEYCLTVSDQNGCTSTACLVLEGSEEIVTSTTVLQNVNCTGENQGAASVSVEGGNMPYTFLWDNGASTATANQLSAGNHIVTITDANNCSTVAEVLITEPEALEVDILINNPTSCGQNNGVLEAIGSGGTGDYSYSWTNNETTTSIASLTAGEYCVSLTDANNCTTSICTTLEMSEAMTATISLNQNLSCFEANDGSATVEAVTGLAPFSYNWDNGETTATAIQLETGEHQVSITDAANCEEVLSITISQPEVLAINIDTINHVSSFGAADGNISASANGGTLPYTFEWDNGIGMVQNPENLAPGTYHLTLTDANGCTENTIVNIIDINLMSITSITVNNVSCNGIADGSINILVEGGEPPYVFNWDNGIEMTANPQGLIAGVYQVTISDDAGQIIEESIEVTEPTPVVLNNFSANSLLCNGDSNGMISVEVEGGLPPYAYHWGNNIPNTPNPENLNAGAYELSVTDANACEFVFSPIEISEPDALGLDPLNIQAPSCFSEADGSISFEVIGGVAPYTFDWEDTISDNNIANNLSPGTYSLTITDVNNCTFSMDFEVQATSQLQATAGSLPDNGSSNGMAWIEVEGGTPPYSLNWIDADMQTTDTVSNLIAGTYVVLITDANNCSLTTTVDVELVFSIDGIAILESLEIFPNPTTDQLSIQLLLEQSEKIHLSLWNSLGQKLEEHPLPKRQQHRLMLNLNAYHEGVYWLQLKIGKQYLSRKIVKIMGN